jgi:hypothetical protein
MAGLKSTINTVITQDVLEKIVRAQVTKAEKGDPAAARFVLELYGASQRVGVAPAAPPEPAVPEDHDSRPTPRIHTTTSTDPLRRRVIACVRNLKRATPGQIAATLLVDVAEVDKVLLENGAFRRCPKQTECFEISPEVA